MYSKLTSSESVWWIVMYEIGQRSAGKDDVANDRERPGAVGARGVEQVLGNRADGRGEDDHAERGADEAVREDDHQQRMVVAQVDRRACQARGPRSGSAAPARWGRPPTATAARRRPTGSSAAAAIRRGRTRPAACGTAVVVSASSSAKVTLKMPSVERTKIAVIAERGEKPRVAREHALEVLEREAA